MDYKENALNNAEDENVDNKFAYLNNSATLIGVINSDLEFNHEIYKEKFYKFEIEVNRLSNTKDYIQVLVSERLMYADELKKGSKVKVLGQYRSYNTINDGKNRLELLLFAKEIEVLDPDTDITSTREFITNSISLHGFICKKPIYRVTPFGREVADLLIAVNRANNKSDYIPCIAWGRTAKFVSNLDVGTEIVVDGRIQSRNYEKKLEGGVVEMRVAYEISIISVELCSNEENKVEETNEENNEEAEALK